MNTEQSDAGQGTILVVDDDTSTRRALRVTLSGMGFTVVEAARGEEALSLARVTWFDAVLLDVDMPGMGGVEACRCLRHEVARLPILMLTVMDSVDDKVLALDAGANLQGLRTVVHCAAGRAAPAEALCAARHHHL